MTLSWVACEAKTGRVIERLPGLESDGVGVTLCRYETATASLPLPTAPRGWERALLEGASFLVLTDGPSNPLWGGLVTRAPRDAGDVITISMVTLEGYADRRYIGDETYTGVGQNEIIADLAEKYIAAGPNGGIPLEIVKLDGDGTPRDREYTDASNQTVYNQWQELAKVAGGPEWTIGWKHLTAPERYVPVLYIGTRVGAAAPAGLGPAATFRIPGSGVTFVQERDYSAQKGANHVTAWSSGEGGARPSQSYTVPDLDRPTFEYRFQPSSNITQDGTLLDHAQRKAADMASGNRALTLVAEHGGRGPQLGRDWLIGDDIGYEIGGARTGIYDVVDPDVFVDTFSEQYATAGVTAQPGAREMVPAFPGGLRGVARALGWRLSLGPTPTVTPILYTGEEG